MVFLTQGSLHNDCVVVDENVFRNPLWILRLFNQNRLLVVESFVLNFGNFLWMVLPKIKILQLIPLLEVLFLNMTG